VSAPKRTLVVGGNRFVGVEILWQLLARGDEVSVLALDAPPTELRPHVRWLQADRNRADLLRKIFTRHEFDAVIDNIAYEPAHVRTLAAALEGRVGRYLLTSTTDTYPRMHPRTWREDQVDIRDYPLDGLNDTERYMYGKRGCEAALAASGLPWTVVRPTVVTGVRDNRNGAPAGRGIHWFEEAARSLFWPARVMDGGPILLASQDQCIFQMIWVADLARAVTQLMDDEKAVGEAYNVAGDEIWNNERLVGALAAAAGVRPDIVHAPAALIEAAGIDYSPAYGTGATWSLADNAKLKATGWRPTPAEQWLPRLLEAVGEPVMRNWYHGRMQEIAFAKHIRRVSAAKASLPARLAAAPVNTPPVSLTGSVTSALGGKLEGAASEHWQRQRMGAAHPVLPRADGFRTLAGGVVSRIGIGTWMGESTDAMDSRYVDTLIHAASRGINVFDTAINYRAMRAERCVGMAVRRLAGMGIPREALFVATKGGYLSYDSQDGRSWDAYVRDEYLARGLIDADEMARRHVLSAAFIEHQLARSLANLDLGTVDLYYLHNPEESIVPLGRECFFERLTGSFTVLESAAAQGRIGAYGLATWEGLRVAPDHPDHLSLERALAAAAEAARRVGNPKHHLTAVQMPFNVRDHQPLTLPTQRVGDALLPAFAAAAELGLYCFTSASVLQGAVVPEGLRQQLAMSVPGRSLHSAALHAARSANAGGTALVGMRRMASVEEAIGVLELPPLDPESVMALVRESGAVGN
jgi:aryl-alcohol dehydrogenase-like predicted oxidoreductase/nucleoside-diphosphate-sugar epimerase